MDKNFEEEEIEEHKQEEQGEQNSKSNDSKKFKRDSINTKYILKCFHEVLAEELFGQFELSITEKRIKDKKNLLRITKLPCTMICGRKGKILFNVPEKFSESQFYYFLELKERRTLSSWKVLQIEVLETKDFEVILPNNKKNKIKRIRK